MEKTSRRRSLIGFLPNRASFSHIPYHPHSPGRENHLQRRGFSGPMVSIVPMEARRKQKNGGFETPQEPTSPKVTCMGQIKLRKMAARCNKINKAPKRPPVVDPSDADRKPPPSSFNIRWMFRRKARSSAVSGGGDSSDAAAEGGGARVVATASPARVRAPLLGQMRRFASGRESLGDFDWRKADAGREEDSDEEEEEVLVPHSAPIMVSNGVVVGVEPRKEVNLWKRRTLSPPSRLQADSPRRRYSQSPSPHRDFSKSRSRSPQPRTRTRSRSRSRERNEVVNPGNTLYITGLSSRVTERELEDHFSKEGKVVKCHLVVEPRTRTSRGFAFVTMDTTEDAERCIKYLNQSILEGRYITVEKSRRGRPRTPTPGKYLGVISTRDSYRSGRGRYRGSYSRDEYGGGYRRSPRRSPYQGGHDYSPRSPYDSRYRRERSRSPYYSSYRSPERGYEHRYGYAR
ncbi:serine/arginine-rich splicing factor SR45a isoform X1 [Canna indica]|uniref:Serine/arginine-rich splicing factor SR45a isoform X1 n=1 Tax=Canna indica TaxID=4628 RepID=A0AAQ3JTG4_9LILI|nr:serine/arginine-rich splicing factor SR45a isoform X1 [Canna indica]